MDEAMPDRRDDVHASARILAAGERLTGARGSRDRPRPRTGSVGGEHPTIGHTVNEDEVAAVGRMIEDVANAP